VVDLQADARLVQFVETQLAGAIGSASARVMVASVVEEESLDLDDVMRILDEASQLRIYSRRWRKSRARWSGHGRAARGQRTAQEPGPAQGRLHVVGDARIAHAFDIDQSAVGADAGRSDMETAQRQQFLGIIVSEAERLSRLVNQVLDMAKIEAGHAEWHNAEVDLRELVRTGRRPPWRDAARAGVALVLGAPGVPVGAGRRRPLTQVMLNLLSNAPSTCPRGAHRGAHGHGADGVTVEVQDNGPGVPPAAGHGVREVPPGGRRRALPAWRHRPGPAHQPPDRGAFRRAHVVAFRAGAGRLLRFFAAVSHYSPAGPTHKTEETPRMSATILIADDEPNILISLEFLMKREGYEVKLARDGQEAMDAIVRDTARPGAAGRDDAAQDRF
jgi:hypothetical protein